MELRCPHKLHGRLVEQSPGGIVEFKCNSQFCGAEPGVVILHRFSTEDGKLLETKRFRDTPRVERNQDGLGQWPAVRSA